MGGNRGWKGKSEDAAWMPWESSGEQAWGGFTHHPQEGGLGWSWSPWILGLGRVESVDPGARRGGVCRPWGSGDRSPSDGSCSLSEAQRGWGQRKVPLPCTCSIRLEWGWAGEDCSPPSLAFGCTPQDSPGLKLGLRPAR